MSPFMEWNLECLRALAALRTPLLDEVFSLLTQLGGETVFMLVMMVVFWCVDKRKGYALMLVGFCGTLLNQALKITFCIPRPWLLDPSFEIVEAARAEATGFSFPSGHTQNAVGIYGTLAWMTRGRERAACLVLTVLVPFSRLYLGVHTPLDVGVSFVLAWLLVLAMHAAYEGFCRRPALLVRLLLALCLLSAAFLLYALHVRSDRTGELTNFDHAVKNGWTMLGLALGAVLTAGVDDRYTRFETKAVWWAQILKVALGLALTLAVRMLLKAPLTALFGANSIGDGIRYFAMLLAAGVFYPMTFGWFASLGRRR